jgi:hypothetical protein
MAAISHFSAVKKPNPEYKFRQCSALVLLIGRKNSPSSNLNVIACKPEFAAAVPNPETEEIHVERTS